MKELYTFGDAFTPPRFWDCMMLSSEERRRQLERSDPAGMLYKSTLTERARYEILCKITNENTHCFGDVADKFYPKCETAAEARAQVTGKMERKNE